MGRSVGITLSSWRVVSDSDHPLCADDTAALAQTLHQIALDQNRRGDCRSQPPPCRHPRRAFCSTRSVVRSTLPSTHSTRGFVHQKEGQTDVVGIGIEDVAAVVQLYLGDFADDPLRIRSRAFIHVAWWGRW